QPFAEHGIQVSNADALAVQLLQKALDRLGLERPLHRRLQPGELLLFLNLDGSLFESHACYPEATRLSPPKDLGAPRDQSRALCEIANSRVRRASNFWSGRRESNPRPTAWKAVTLPLSYSRVPTAAFP